ncbi:MAG: hypothetical protein RLZZ299_2084 [Pseudomonadota bacterium]
MTRLLLIAACASGGPGGAGDPPVDTAESDGAAGIGTGGESDALSGVPTHWSIAGTLVLADGELVAAETSLRVDVVDAGLGVRVCAMTLDATDAGPVDADAAVARPRGAWGPLPVPPPGCTAATPARVDLALGDVPVDVGAQASADTATMLGAWASVDGAPSVAFGLAAPPETSSPEGGLADGAWVLTPVYGWALAAHSPAPYAAP